jgi:hypothetical protein
VCCYPLATIGVGPGGGRGRPDDIRALFHAVEENLIPLQHYKTGHWPQLAAWRQK